MQDNLSLYKYFVTVVEEKSITSAAKKLYISQPAVSSAINKLESQLGVNLFVRGNRGITLTGEGKMLYEHLTKAFTFIKAGEDKLCEIAGLRGGILRIGASDMTLRFFLLDAIEKFMPLHSDVRLQITNNPTPRTLDELRHGSIDVCVVSSPIEEDGELCVVPVRPIRDIFVCAPTYTKKRVMTPEELLSEHLIMLDRDTSSRKYVERCLFGEGNPGFAPDIELATSELTLDFAARGLGIASVVEDFALPYLESGRLCRVELTSPLPERQMLLVYYKNIPQAAATDEFIRLCTSLRCSGREE